MRRKFKTIEFEFLRSFKGTKNKNELLELFNNNFEKITLNQLEPLLRRYKIPFKKLPSLRKDLHLGIRVRKQE